jgi:cytochrome oxidase Cu insertion factor (SCO1/SenC/PrrC family)/thiol-disulfide isomerase/thioredoxin
MKARVATLAVTLLAVLATGLATRIETARADGDPGSDVLVYQPLFLASDSGISVAEQVKLGNLLQSAQGAHFPIRVAIIAGPADLGAVTALWRKPQAYASFLGIELSLTYTGRLLVVMPNGFGFNWPGHSTAPAYRTLARIPIGAGGAGLAAATQAAVGSLAAADGVRLGTASQPIPSAPATPRPATPQPASSSTAPAASGSGADSLVALIVAGLAVIAGLAFLARRRLGRWPRPTLRTPRARPVVGVAAGLTLLAGAVAVVLIVVGRPAASPSEALASNPYLDPGTALSRVAPDFTLTDQFGRSVSLRSFRGKVVLLAFNDSECTTICPLTTTAMLDAKAMLGRAGDNVQLLGVDANPKATSLEDVYSYSQLHGMLTAWHFLTGSLSQLQSVWKAYDIEAAVQGGEIAHTPALFVIDARGVERSLYITQQSYAAVGQLGQLLAQEASQLLPGHPAVNSHLSYNQISGIPPSTSVTVPRAGGGTLRLGPGRPRVYAFFATWDQQVLGLAAGLEGLAGYSAEAHRLGLPALEAVDEGIVEPPGALSRFLTGLPRPLSYPVAIDGNGRLADGYEVEGLPWLMVVSATGKIAWYYSVAALGWPSTKTLIERVREALAYAAAPPAGASAAQAELAGSPPALATLHHQADQILGSEPALAARVRALRGYPIVINAWASWCPPCRSEFALFASASAQYGRQVAFLGADTNDSAGDAQAFLAQHPVSYPSYQTSMNNVSQIVPQGLEGLPTTIFINRAGKLTYVHTGQYDAQGTLDADIQSYALGG